MDSMRSLNTSLPRASAARQPVQTDRPEELVDIFKSAALEVTKLYKKSTALQATARNEGYQDCLDDLLAFLDKEKIGLGDGVGRRIRSWATERLDGREGSQNAESDDEADKPEATSGSEAVQSSQDAQGDNQMTTDVASPAAVQSIDDEPEVVPVAVPTQDSFTFRSSHPWPPQPPQQDAYLNLANLDLSDSRTRDGTSPNATGGPRTSRPRHPSTNPRSSSRQGSALGRGAGSKRKINLAELFDIDFTGLDKNKPGGPPKRNRHT
ncbi:hypothetical protein CTRI78_v005778 [Colletotrichum trifolii]|uniref:Uncharacterized protein n=1 Tax=Colletotrichum trifolii TaxID=5466 RepID=A0A4R8RKW6_COLTR|nr:hypothetical protein CTRI78_v005778 [Colletotrichum trifolii]